jgi:hypothetical protein
MATMSLALQIVAWIILSMAAAILMLPVMVLIMMFFWPSYWQVELAALFSFIVWGGYFAHGFWGPQQTRYRAGSSIGSSGAAAGGAAGGSFLGGGGGGGC